MKTTTPLSDIYSGAQNYVTLQARALQLKYVRTLTDAGHRVYRSAGLALTGLFALLFFSVALAFWLSKAFHSFLLGFACVGTIYLLALAAFALFARRREQAIKDRIVRDLDKKIPGYNALLQEQASLQNRIAKQKEELNVQLEELKSALQEIETRMAGKHGEENGQEQAGGSGKLGQRIMGTAVEILLQAFVLPKAGLVKRTVVPLVANAFMRSKFFREGKGKSFLQNLKLRISNFL